MNENEIIKCRVVGFQEYGMFVNCGEYDGLVHISEISDQFVNDIEQIFKLDDELELLVLGVNHESKRLKLSYKKCHEMNKRIIKNIQVKIGFHSLNTKLDGWVADKKKEIEDL